MSQQKYSAERIFLAVFALIGVVVMGYLISLHYSSQESSFCDLGKGISCTSVNQSYYSAIFGIPMSALGILYFLGVLALVLFRYRESALKTITLGTITLLGPSFYLSVIEFKVLHDICIFCEISKVLMVIIIVLSYLAIEKAYPTLKQVIGAVVLALLLAGFTWLAQASTIPGGEYNVFAQCLTEKGFIMYGSITCPHCANQRAKFGDAFQYIHEVECNPNYSDNAEDPKRCLARGVRYTPTWIQETEDGIVLQRLTPGEKNLGELSKASGCALSAE